MSHMKLVFLIGCSLCFFVRGGVLPEKVQVGAESHVEHADTSIIINATVYNSSFQFIFGSNDRQKRSSEMQLGNQTKQETRSKRSVIETSPENCYPDNLTIFLDGLKIEVFLNYNDPSNECANTSSSTRSKRSPQMNCDLPETKKTEPFDPTPFISMVNKFPIKELNDILKAHGWSTQASKNVRSKVIEMLKSSDGPAASVTMLDVKRTKLPPIDLDNPMEIAQLAQKITNDLIVENERPNYNEHGNMMEPWKDMKQYFDRAFLLACNNRINAFKLRSVTSIGWNSIGETGRQKWKSLREKMIGLHNDYLEDGNELLVHKKKPFYTEHITEMPSNCYICHDNKRRLRDVIKHAKTIHFPDHSTDDSVDTHLDQFIENVKKDPFGAEFHEQIISLWHAYTNDQLTSEQEQKIQKGIELFNEVQTGEKTSYIYVLAQVTPNLESISIESTPTTFFRYIGKKGGQNFGVRHFLPHGPSHGNVGREITKIMQKHLAGRTESKDRLYQWKAMECSSNSLEVLEQAVIIATWHVTDRNSSIFWNQRLEGVPKGKLLRNQDPEELVYLGIVALKKMSGSFKEQTTGEIKQVFNSKELLDVFDGFNDQEKAMFIGRYKLAESAISQVNALQALNHELLEKLRLTAIQLESDDLLAECTSFKDQLQKILTGSVIPDEPEQTETVDLDA